MMSWTNLKTYANPVLFLLLALFIREPVAGLDDVYLDLLQYLPYLVFAVLLALGIYYNRSRQFIMATICVVVYFLIQSQLQTSLENPEALLIYSLVSLVLPALLLLCLFMPERGLLNRHGLVQFVVLAAIIFSCFLAINMYSASLLDLVIEWMPVKPLTGFVLSVPAMACFVLLAGLCIYWVQALGDDYALMILTIALFCLLTLAKLHLAYISMVLLSGMGFSLLVTVLGTTYDMAYRDELTSLLGRRALNDRLRGLGRQYVLAMMDVDHFKKFNDTHGHDIGDEVLKMVAAQIGKVGGGGIAYRYGGEEFCVVFPRKDIEYCKPYLEEVRRDIEAYRLKLRNSSQRPKSDDEAKKRRGRRATPRKEATVSVTISIGMAQPGDKHPHADGVLKQADKALYKAKKKGRNCLVY